MDPKKIEELLQVDLLKELGLENLPQEKKLSLLDDLGEIIMKGVWLKIADTVTEEQAEKLSEIMDTDDTGIAYFEYLKNIIPNFEAIVKEEMAKQKELILAAKVNK